MTTKDVIEHTHMCVSCEHLLRVTRSVRKDKTGRHIGFRFTAACSKRKNKRNPWIAIFCRHFEWMDEQKTLKSWLRFAAECENADKKEETESINPGSLDSEDAQIPKKKDPEAGS